MHVLKRLGWLSWSCCITVLLTGCITHKPTQPVAEGKGMATGFINKTMRVDGEERRYVVYVPFDYDPRKDWPVILSLHGAGERGDDGLIQTEVGIGTAIRRWSDRFPCIVVLPQCPKKVWWNGAFEHAQCALTKTIEEYRCDPHRIYLTGLSLGGYGTWKLGAERADLFAALMPICGGGDPNDAGKLAKTPIWAFHGGQDKTVSPLKSRQMVEAIQKAGGNVQYTEYPDLEHNSWDRAYGDKVAIAWLLAQRK